MQHEFWTLSRVARALDLPAYHGTDRALRAVATDTRTLQPGDLFVALAGERFDAHDFLAEAVAAGAAALVVRDPARAMGLGVPVFVVEDTLHALGALGRFFRAAWSLPVVAVGGSNGKTSTKELLKAALGARFTVHATTGNLNNQVGTPLTLLSLPNGADCAVVEVGTNIPGEIAILRAIVAPDIAVVTCVQEEHLEGFGDLAGVLAEEASLFDETELAVVPVNETGLIAEAKRRAKRVITAGLGAGDVASSAHGLNADGTGWLTLDGVRVDVPLRGEHNLRNAMLALAVARECGIAAADAARGFAAMPQPSMRSSVEPLGRALLINDAYNANPGSMRAALSLLAAVGTGRQRVAVLGTMRELGPTAPALHRDIARVALASGADVVAGIGDFQAALAAEGAGDQRVVTAGDVDDLWPVLQQRLQPDAAILLKASRGVRLERLLPHLQSWAGPAA
ncbi:MAG: UDP-N-acetylmuramoyl-tripeptide--D-alanyl-D-alanine ligase [Gemmatimonadetes bacterium]|nr:UDP-N-acetylmuramoyl-tripeptide--D-alanyl-D-alanine ligase [Gemmatimonadota bacterium]